MNKQQLGIILLLHIGTLSYAQSTQDTISRAYNVSYHVITVKDYSFDELMDEGINTSARQLELWHVPIRQFRAVIKWHIKRHNFSIGKKERNKTTFKAVTFTYPSLSPQGEPVMLSGLVTIPLLNGNKIGRMLVYHRLLATYNSIAPSNSLPIEAVLSADNTICVFPDYYGCGITQGNPLPFAALNYHARCATECAIAALNIVRDNGIAIDTGFYTWTTGYSQAGGYALATHRFVENSLPDSLSNCLNLRWSLCCNGIFSPAKLYEHAILEGDMGSTPSVFLQSLRGLFTSHPEQMDGLSIRDLLSEKALETGIDSIMCSYDNGLWDLFDKLDGRDKSHDPAYYFSPFVLDTSTSLYKTVSGVLNLDDCVSGWHPQSCAVICHSTKDDIIPFRLSEQAQTRLADTGGCCLLATPKHNKSHLVSGFYYYFYLLRYNENELYRRFIGSHASL